MKDKKQEQKKDIQETGKIIERKFEGVVVSDKMDKTVVVKIDRTKINPKYGKRYSVSKKYKAHDENNFYKEGDKVTITSSRPVSKDKMWRVIYNK